MADFAPAYYELKVGMGGFGRFGSGPSGGGIRSLHGAKVRHMKSVCHPKRSQGPCHAGASGLLLTRSGVIRSFAQNDRLFSVSLLLYVHQPVAHGRFLGPDIEPDAGTLQHHQDQGENHQCEDHDVEPVIGDRERVVHP